MCCFSKTNIINVQKVDKTESDRGSRQPVTVVQTSSECVKGVDLAVGRRIKWLIGGARRGEGAKRSALPLSWFLFLSLPRSPSLCQEKRPLGLNKQITWPWNTTHHRCSGTSFRQHFTGLCSVLVHTSKKTNIHAHACKHTLFWLPPSTWQWFYKSP